MFKKILNGQIRDGKTKSKKMPKNSVGKKGRNVFKKTIDDQRRKYIEYLQTIKERFENTRVIKKSTLPKRKSSGRNRKIVSQWLRNQ